MSWQTILLIVLTALLVLVWLPWIIVSIRKVMRETSGRPASSCHPELVEGSPTDSNNKK